MKRMRRLRHLAALFLLAQVVVGYAGWFTSRHEIFPFSAWFMFALVPNRLTEYDLLIHGTLANPQEPARSFTQSATFVHAPHSIVSHQLIQQFGEAVERKEGFRIEQLRPQLEEQFAVAQVRYDLVKLNYFPVARWKTSQVLSSRLLGSFVSTGQPLQNPDRPPPLEQEPDAMTPNDASPPASP